MRFFWDFPVQVGCVSLDRGQREEQQCETGQLNLKGVAGRYIGSCLTLGNELSKEKHVLLNKAADLIGKRCPGREKDCEETQENCSVTWPTVSGFMVIRLVSGLSLANSF